MEPKRITVHYKGSLRNVGFEFTSEKLAKKLGLTGTVQSRTDGSIELVAEGADSKLSELLTAIRLSPLDSRITDEQVFRSPATGEFKGCFCAKH